MNLNISTLTAAILGPNDGLIANSVPYTSWIIIFARRLKISKLRGYIGQCDMQLYAKE